MAREAFDLGAVALEETDEPIPFTTADGTSFMLATMRSLPFDDAVAFGSSEPTPAGNKAALAILLGDQAEEFFACKPTTVQVEALLKHWATCQGLTVGESEASTSSS